MSGNTHYRMGAGVVALAWIAGCGSQVGLTANAISGSVLRPGIYTGDMLCEGTFTDVTGTVRTQDVFAGRRVIGSSGLPVENGLEAREGNTLEREFGGFTVTVVIEAVTVTANGVVVDSSGSAVSDVCTDADCTSVETQGMEMITSESYKASGQSTIEFSSSMWMIVSINGQTGSGQAVCTGVLSP